MILDWVGSIPSYAYSHIALTSISSGGIQLYVNGTLVTSSTGQPGFAVLTCAEFGAASAAGSTVAATDRSFTGTLGAASIWSRQLSALDIAIYMRRRPTAGETGLYGSWMFTGISTTDILADSSANGRNLLQITATGGNIGTFTATPSPTNTPSETCTPSITATPSNTRTATGTRTSSSTKSLSNTPSQMPSSTVTKCAAGTYSASGNAPCTPCAAGSFAPYIGHTSISVILHVHSALLDSALQLEQLLVHNVYLDNLVLEMEIQFVRHAQLEQVL